MEAEQLRAFSETARRFARQEVMPLLGAETRDGNLEALPDLLDKAESVGILAGTAPDSPGHEFGVWGKACLEEGPAFSLTLLEEVARVCAGVGACLHFAGMGSLESGELANGNGKRAVAFFEDTWRLNWDTVRIPPASATRLEKDGGTHTLSGSKSFVHMPPGCEGFVVYARGDTSGWHRVFVPIGAPGLAVSGLGQRTGLAALEVVRLTFKRTPLDQGHFLEPHDPSPLLQRVLLGLCAIAIGNARGALEAARNYAEERYQGGGQIETHAAVRMLLGDAASRIYASSSHLLAEAQRDTDTMDALLRAFAAKLRIPTDCCQAVTDCLQVLGGYGYMEDYRLEKRLRDALTLKVLGLKPDDLRMLCAGADPGGLQNGG